MDDGRTRLPFVHLTDVHRASLDASGDLEDSAESRTGGLSGWNGYILKQLAAVGFFHSLY